VIAGVDATGFETEQEGGCIIKEPVFGTSAVVGRVLGGTLVTLRGEYGLLTQLSLDASIDRLVEAVLFSRTRTLGDEFAPGATRLLQAVEAELREDGEAPQADAAADWLSGSDAASHLAQLDTLLQREGVGLDQAVDALASELGARGAQLSVMAQLTATEQLDYLPLSLTALDEDGERPLTLKFGESGDEDAVRGSLGASFDGPLSALSVKALRLELGLGSYAASLTAALWDDDDAGLDETLRDAAGCDVFGEWLTSAPEAADLASVCGEACVQRACERAIDGLLDDTLADVENLDQAHPGIGLRGEVPVHDLDGDGIADLVDNAAISGSWGRSESATTTDLVEGTLSSAALE